MNSSPRWDFSCHYIQCVICSMIPIQLNLSISSKSSSFCLETIMSACLAKSRIRVKHASFTIQFHGSPLRPCTERWNWINQPISFTCTEFKHLYRVRKTMRNQALPMTGTRFPAEGQQSSLCRCFDIVLCVYCSRPISIGPIHLML